MKKNNSNPVGTALVTEYLAANPSLPSRTIARHIFNDPKNKGVWKDLDAARQSVRYYRGAHGVNSKRYKKTLVAPPSPLSNSVEAIEANPFYLPVSDSKEWKPYVILASSNDRTLILNDIHLPYHEKQAIELAIKEGKRRQVNRIILNGDTLDFYQLSRFSRDPRLRSFSGEIEMGKQLIEALREQFPDAEIIWKDGNHEERYQHYLEANAKELIGVAEFRFEVLMDFFNSGVVYVNDKRPIHLGHNILVHGHEFGQQIFSPVNPARGLFMKAKHNSACGHHHATSEHTARSLDGKVIVCWSVGCLCHINPAYRPINDWNHGFAFQETQSDGMFDFENKRILNGRVL